MVREGSSGKLVRLLCGICMVLTVLRPIPGLALPDLSRYLSDLDADSRAAVTAGTQLARDAQLDGIKQRTETYILDKAQAMGLALRVEVTLVDGYPGAVTVSGHATDAEKALLEEMILRDLGISKENQVWQE